MSDALQCASQILYDNASLHIFVEDKMIYAAQQLAAGHYQRPVSYLILRGVTHQPFKVLAPHERVGFSLWRELALLVVDGMVLCPRVNPEHPEPLEEWVKRLRPNKQVIVECKGFDCITPLGNPMFVLRK